MVQSGLVGHWPLHEWSGRANDLSGNDVTGSVSGSPERGVSAPGGLTGWNFDSSTPDYITLSDTSALTMGTGGMAISVWLRIGSGDSMRIFDTGARSDEGYTMFYNAPSILAQVNDPNLNRQSIGGQVQIEDGNWHHCVASWDRKGATKVWVDVELTEARAFPYDESVSIDNFATPQIGREATLLTQTYDGDMHDLRVYGRPLSHSEVQHLYEIGSVDVATPPAEEDSAAVARYEFDDRSDPTTALDTFGSNNGTINGATYSADSIRGLSMNFDGSNDYIDAGDTPSSVSNITVSSWFNVDQLPSSDTTYEVLRKENEYILQLRSSAPDTVAFYVYDSSSSSYVQVETTTQISANSWLHAAGSYDGSNTRVYLNGVLEAETSYTGGMNDTTNSLGIGADGAATGGFLDGNIDDVRIYNRALSDEEIHQLYNWGTRGIDRRYELIRK